MNEISSGERLLAEKGSRAPMIALYAVIIVLVGLLLFYFFISYSPINGESMENTIHDGQSVVLLRRGFDLDRGDLVTIDVSEKQNNSHNIIKRVIGKAGDRILFVRSENTRNVYLYTCKNGKNNFELLDEPYIKEQMRASVSYGDYALLPFATESVITSIDLDSESADPKTELLRNNILNACITVPPSQFFFLGDNRNNSSDSRHYGTQPTKRIVGKVIGILDRNSAPERIMRLLFGII